MSDIKVGDIVTVDVLAQVYRVTAVGETRLLARYQHNGEDLGPEVTFFTSALRKSPRLDGAKFIPVADNGMVLGLPGGAYVVAAGAWSHQWPAFSDRAVAGVMRINVDGTWDWVDRNGATVPR